MKSNYQSRELNADLKYDNGIASILIDKRIKDHVHIDTPRW